MKNQEKDNIHAAAAPSAEQALLDALRYVRHARNWAQVESIASEAIAAYEAGAAAKTEQASCGYTIEWQGKVQGMYSGEPEPEALAYWEKQGVAVRRLVYASSEASVAGAAAKTEQTRPGDDRNFLQWVHDRLRFVHSENENYDYMHKLRAIIAAMPVEKSTPNVASIAAGAGSEQQGASRAALDVKTWQERTPFQQPWAQDAIQWEIHRAKDAEIADLRAALARAPLPAYSPSDKGIPREAMEAANALLFDMIDKREWDVPCAAKHIMAYAASQSLSAHPGQDGEKDAKGGVA